METFDDLREAVRGRNDPVSIALSHAIAIFRDLRELEPERRELVIAFLLELLRRFSK